MQGSAPPYALDALRHRIATQLMPAYDIQGNLLHPTEYQSHLAGAMVHLLFSINRYPAAAVGSSTRRFLADIERVRPVL